MKNCSKKGSLYSDDRVERCKACTGSIFDRKKAVLFSSIKLEPLYHCDILNSGTAVRQASRKHLHVQELTESCD